MIFEGRQESEIILEYYFNDERAFLAAYSRCMDT